MQLKSNQHIIMVGKTKSLSQLAQAFAFQTRPYTKRIPLALLKAHLSSCKV
jgi:hypothetical protein